MPESAEEGTPTPQSRLDDRYGRTRSFTRKQRTIAIIVAAGFFAVFGAWVVWAGLSGDAASIEARNIGHTIVDDSLVTVTYEVTAEPGEELGCAVEALNEGFSVVGWKVVQLEPSEERTRQFTEDVRTSELAVSGLIYRCWLE